MQKTSILFLFSILSFVLASQSNLKFENRKIYIGEIDISSVYSVNFNFENISGRELSISYEPITNLVNATYPKNVIANATGLVKMSFYPDSEGPFNESIYIIVDNKEKIELSIYGIVSSIAKSYKSLTESNKLFGDRDIAFMVVDAQTYKPIPFSKVFIRNTVNQKSYIGVANRYGVLINRIPEGKYSVQALINNYNKEILDIKLDANRNVAMILLERKESKDTLQKKPIKKIDTIPSIAKEEITPSPTHLDSSNSLISSTELPIISNTSSKNSEILADEIKNSTPTSSQDSKIQSEAEIITTTRKPLNIILLIDVSKSMEKPNRIGVLKKSIANLIQSYQEMDHLAILTFNDKVHALMKRSKIVNKNDAISLVQSILPSGTTDGVLGMDMAFEMLQENYMPDAINMVIIATDGKINKYASDDKLLLEKIEKMNESGILTSVVGFTTTISHQAKLVQMADVGGGVFIDMNIDTENIENSLIDEIYSTLMNVK